MYIPIEWGNLVKMQNLIAFYQGSFYLRSGLGHKNLRSKFPSGADVAGSGTTLGVARPLHHSFSCVVPIRVLCLVINVNRFSW